VNVSVHQTIGADLGLRPLRCSRQHAEVMRIVAIIEERPLPPVTALGDVMRDAWDYGAGQAAYGTSGDTAFRALPTVLLDRLSSSGWR
jgi:hypothetical protein